MAQQDGGGARQAPFAVDGQEFRNRLKRHREALRWSQERLATESAMDHSLVSRLESGQRSPTREAIEKLARGLRLEQTEKDRLLIAAGYFPERAANAVGDEPSVRRIYLLLHDENTPAPVRDRVREVLAGLADIALAS